MIWRHAQNSPMTASIIVVKEGGAGAVAAMHPETLRGLDIYFSWRKSVPYDIQEVAYLLAQINAIPPGFLCPPIEHPEPSGVVH